MDVFLFTYFFPFERAEPFLINEFPFLKRSAASLKILALYGQNTGPVVLKEEKLNSAYVLEGPLNRKELFFSGIFSLAPFGAHLRDAFRHRKNFNLKRLGNFITSLLVTRAALSSKAYKDLVKSIRSAKSPLLYFYWGDNLCWVLPYLVKEAGRTDLKVVMRLHGTDLYEVRKGGSAPLRDQVFALADLVFAISENGRDYLAEKYPLHSGKIKVARLGVPDRGENPPGKQPAFVVVSVANVVPVKRVHLLFMALQALSVEIVWHHFGAGPLLSELRATTSAARKGLAVQLHGSVENEKIIRFYQEHHADVFVNTSSAEGVPVAIMEALSFGIPVIAPAIGGIPELVSNDCGALLPADFTIASLVSAIAAIAASDDESTTNRRANARKAFKEKADAPGNYGAFYRQLAALSAGDS